ncbi:MAG: pyrimidine 5'-nucleotidase [Desulfonatronovibrio sp.]|nr:pyrimidine 5'-nucleotidase [Desulfovibrionales bacterium]
MKKYIFDLDNTLYCQTLNVFPLIDQRINRYMTTKLGIPEDGVDTLRRQYWKLYGVTLNGLMIHYNVDPEDYLEYVHDVDLKHILKPDKELKTVLREIPCSKVIFTNGSRAHAENVLQNMGLEDLFDDIFDVRVASFRPKPFPEPYLEILKIMDVQGKDCVMIDDIPENLKTAKNLDMKTILIGKSNGQDHIDICLDNASAIRTVINIL